MKYLFYVFRFIIFWLFFFLLNRIFFALFFIEEVSTASVAEILTIVPKSLALDVSFISYMLVPIVVLIWLKSFFKNKQFITKMIYWITSFFLLISGLISGGEVALYSEWQSKLNFTALAHFKHPSEVFSTASMGHIFTVLFFLLTSVVFIRIYKNKVHSILPIQYPYWLSIILIFLEKLQGYIILMMNRLHISLQSAVGVLKKVLVLAVSLGILLLGIRGGFQLYPINLSAAYFSKNEILNDIAVNPNWNIMQSILKSRSHFKGNPYKKYSDKECEAFMLELNASKKDTSISIVNIARPNIVFVLLESWSADNVESLGGLKGITPNFKSLEKEGVLFTDFYSNGFTSDQAMSSIFSSFPVFPYVAIINQSVKARKLPCLNKTLSTEGYHSSYFYGGQLEYGDIKAYLYSQAFDLIKDASDYKNLPSGSLGVHDEFMFAQFRQELNELPEPFMSILFTVSSHSPFDFPGPHKLSFNSREDKYINSVAYSDKCLGNFMASVKNEDWYANTLFVIVADHSHNSPKRWRIAQKEHFKIPMLWTGEVLKKEYQGKKHVKMGSHIDISTSLLAQLNLNTSAFHFGNDLFNPTANSIVPFAFAEGYGLITPKANFAFSESYNKVFESNVSDSISAVQIKKAAELYFQAAFKEYMEL